MTAKEAKEEYEINPDFKEYIDKYCKKFYPSIPLDVVFYHMLPRIVGDQYKERRES